MPPYIQMGSLFSGGKEAPAPPLQGKEIKGFLEGIENRAAARATPAPPQFETRVGLLGIAWRVPVRPGGAGPEEAPAGGVLRGRAQNRMAAAYGVSAGTSSGSTGDALRGRALGRMAAAYGVSAGTSSGSAGDALRGRALGRMAAAYGVSAGTSSGSAGDALRGRALGRMAAARGDCNAGGETAAPGQIHRAATWREALRANPAFRRAGSAPPGRPRLTRPAADCFCWNRRPAVS